MEHGIGMRWPRCECQPRPGEGESRGDEPRSCGRLARWSVDVGGGASYFCGECKTVLAAAEENAGVEWHELKWKGCAS